MKRIFRKTTLILIAAGAILGAGFVGINSTNSANVSALSNTQTSLSKNVATTADDDATIWTEVTSTEIRADSMVKKLTLNSQYDATTDVSRFEISYDSKPLNNVNMTIDIPQNPTSNITLNIKFTSMINWKKDNTKIEDDGYYFHIIDKNLGLDQILPLKNEDLISIKDDSFKIDKITNISFKFDIDIQNYSQDMNKENALNLDSLTFAYGDDHTLLPLNNLVPFSLVDNDDQIETFEISGLNKGQTISNIAIGFPSDENNSSKTYIKLDDVQGKPVSITTTKVPSTGYKIVFGVTAASIGLLALTIIVLIIFGLISIPKLKKKKIEKKQQNAIFDRFD